MQLTCPSCGTKHNTDDFPGAFEIPCPCGYSMIVPDMESDAPSPENLDPAEPFFKSPPLSFEEQDKALQNSTKEEEKEGKSVILSNQMTGPEDLPSEMPYDPFELGDKEKSSGQQTKNEEGSSLDLDYLEEDSDDLGENPSITPPPIGGALEEQLLNRLQMASMGRIVGSSFDLRVMNLDDDKIHELHDFIQKFLENQVWLTDEIAKRRINIKECLKEKRFEKIPEALAVEIYLRSFELGGICQFEKTDFVADF